MKEKEDLQKLVKVINCCSGKDSFDVNIFNPTAEDADKVWELLGDKYERRDNMQTGCFVTHFTASDVCGYLRVEITLFRNKEEGGK